MKKILGVIPVVLMLLVLGACGGKMETTTFTQSPVAGMEISIMVEHKGDKIAGAKAKAVLDNEKLKITDEAASEQVVEDFKYSSNLEDVKVKYTKKETVITYDAGSVKQGTSFKASEEELTDTGFEKK